MRTLSNAVERDRVHRAVGARITGRQTTGEGEAAWEDVLFTLATEAPAAFRRG